MPLGILGPVKVQAWELNSEMGIEIETTGQQSCAPTRLGDDYWDSLNKPTLAIRDNPARSSGL